jgi:hypothetical protein
MERRLQFRVECDLAVSFQIPGTGQEGEARIVNLGLGGTRVDLPIEVALPAVVVLTLTPPTPEGATDAAIPLQLRGHVMWTVTERSEGPYPTGLQFREMPDAVRRRLYAILPELEA